MIDVEGLCYDYGDGTEALKGIDLELPAGAIFAIMGASGSGKTTLLHCMARFRQPKSGRICLDGTDIRDISEAEFRSRVGVVFQKLHLFPHLSILENMILAPCKVRRESRAAAMAAAMVMLERLGIVHLAGHYPAQVSGGQAQRAAIGRGLMLRPSYLLLDEPTSALDPQTTRDFADWLLELQEETTFVIVTHDLDFSRQVASQGVLLEDGNLIRHGRISEIIGPTGEKGAT